MNHSFFKDPEVTLFCPCPNCARLLELELEQCPFCRELIGEEYKIIGTVLTALETQACSLANTISTGDPAVIFFLAWDALGWFVGIGWLGGFFLLNMMLTLAAIGRWFWRYGRLPLDNAEFRKAKRSMRHSLLLWLALAFFQTIFVIYSCLFSSGVQSN